MPVRIHAAVRAAFLLVVLATTPLAAQQRATTGSIRGRVADEAGAPLAGVVVQLADSATGVVREGVSGADGRFQLSLIPPGGPYLLTAARIGYERHEGHQVIVGAGERLTLDVVLATAAVRVEGVGVQAGGVLQVDRGGVIQRVSQAEVQRLPVRGRDLMQFVNLSPLVSLDPDVQTGGRISVAGARAAGTTFQVDGVDAGNLFFGETQGSSRSPFAYSLESIRELQVITNGFDVEYGNYQGGLVNALTRHGTNTLSAATFLYHRNEALTGSGFDRLPAAAYRTYQFGATLSGPIIRDRLHWLVVADVQRKNLPVETGSAAVVGWEPAAHEAVVDRLTALGAEEARSWLGPTTGHENNSVLFGRLDWNVSADHRLVLRQNYADLLIDFDGLQHQDALTHGGSFRNRAASTVAELNSVLGGGLTQSIRLQYSNEDRPRRPPADGGYLPELVINHLPLTAGGTSAIHMGGDPRLFRNRLRERKAQFVYTASLDLGRHTLKIGTSDILSRARHVQWDEGNGAYTYASDASFAVGEPLRYSRRTRACPVALVANAMGEVVVCPTPDLPEADFTALEWSLYAQDEWRATDRVTLMAGVRFGGTRMGARPDAVPDVEEAFGLDTDVVPSFTGLSPRMAFSYEAPGAARLVVRGGAGIMMGRAPLVLAANAFSGDRPMRQILCTGDEIPTLDLGGLLATPRGGANPAACRSGSARLGRPEYTVFADDFKLPRSLKANVSLEGSPHQATRITVDLMASRTTNNFTVRDANLAEPQFFLLGETACAGCPGRPVFVPTSFGPRTFQPAGVAGEARLRHRAFDRVYVTSSDGEARSMSLALELRRRVSTRLEGAIRYAWNRASDNSTFSCCTSRDGFALEPTAGDPNFVGGPGDAARGTWAPSSYERRHVVVASALLEGPLGVRIDGVVRLQSGTPWTPLVAGDINGDGLDRNDRPYVGTDVYMTSGADSAAWQQLLQHECLSAQVGTVARRNSCRNPWWNSLDVRLHREVETWRGQRAEFSLDLYNVLNGLHWGMGQYAAVSREGQVLLHPVDFVAEGFMNPETGAWEVPPETILYRPNPSFGSLRPIGFEPYQFQAQLGVRYRF